MEREKKQFRLFDVYRQSFTGTSSKIRGIKNYRSSKYFDETEISITYNNGLTIEFTAKNENELKEIIRRVNKELKNCCKPGRKSKKH